MQTGSATEWVPPPPGVRPSVPAPRMGALALWLSIALVVLVLWPADALGQQCPPWENGGEEIATISNDDIVESSGLAASRRYDGMIWTHNDSGNDPEIYLLNTDGTTAATVRLEGAKARDWEDMAIAPCSATHGPKSTEKCIYLAEIGDNNTKHDTVEILKFPEPEIPEERPASVTIEKWRSIEYAYEDGPRNAETLLVHPKSANLYVVQKSDRRRANVYRVPNRVTEEATRQTAKKVAELPIDQGIGRQVTAGDFAPDGREFSIRTYVKVYTFCANPDEPFETAFSASPVISQPKLTIQSEALTYTADGEYLVFTSEGKHPPMVRMDRDRSTSTGKRGGEEDELDEEIEKKAKQARRETESTGDENAPSEE